MQINSTQSNEFSIELDDNFASLINIEKDGSFIYQFRYFATSYAAILRGCSTVKITVRKVLQKASEDIFTSVANMDIADSAGMVENIRTKNARAKDAAKSNEADIVATALSDLTAAIDNSVASKLVFEAKKIIGAANLSSSPFSKQVAASLSPSIEQSVQSYSKKQRAIALKPVYELQKKNIDASIMQFALFDHAEAPTPKQAKSAAVSLLGAGIDPSIAGGKFSCVNSTFKSLTGVSNIVRYPGEISNTNELSNIAEKQKALVSSLHQPSSKTLLQSDFDAKTLIPVACDVQVSKLLNFKQIRVDANIVGNQDFYATFELLDYNGVAVKSITKLVAHNRFVRLFNTPRIPPRIDICPVQFRGKNVIEIQQMDPRAKRIMIMRRAVKNTASYAFSDMTRYSIVRVIDLEHAQGPQPLTDDVNNDSRMQYRCIAIGPSGLLGGEFTNAISPAVQSKSAQKNNISNFASIITRTVSNGIEIVVVNAPDEAIAVAITKKDATASAGFSYVGEKISIATGLSQAVVVDTDVKKNRFYEYGCMLYFKDGTEKPSTTKIARKYVPLTTGKANIVISDLSVVQKSRNTKSANVSFVINSTLTTSDATQKIVANSITRTDLTDGKVDYLGIAENNKLFIDATFSESAGAEHLKKGHRYRYTIMTLARDATTLSDGRVQAFSVATGKKYNYKPSIFRHPYALSTGTLASHDALASNYPENELEYGALGNVHEIEVMIDDDTVRIVDVVASRADGRTMSVLWNIEGDVSMIDHFIVMKSSLGQTRIAGKVHNVSQGNILEFLDHITPDDIGENVYNVIPVMSDFSRGLSVLSNVVVVEDIRSKQ
jgi:hypothetical protein